MLTINTRTMVCTYKTHMCTPLAHRYDIYFQRRFALRRVPKRSCPLLLTHTLYQNHIFNNTCVLILTNV